MSKNAKINAESLIVSTLGFTPNLIYSEKILTFFKENFSINLMVKEPIQFIVLYPNLLDFQNLRTNAIDRIKKKIKYDTKFFEIDIENFESATIQIMGILLQFINKITPYDKNIFFNLSGGINLLILAAYTVSQYLPTKKIIFFIENTELIQTFTPIIHKLKLEIIEQNVLKIFESFNEKLNLKQIVKKLTDKLLYKKDRTLVYRHVKKLEGKNLIEGDYQSARKILYKLSLNGYLNKLALEYFPEIIIDQNGDKQR